MGLMDRDYYREKAKPHKERVLDKLKRNPIAVVIAVILLLILISYLV